MRLRKPAKPPRNLAAVEVPRGRSRLKGKVESEEPAEPRTRRRGGRRKAEDAAPASETPPSPADGPESKDDDKTRFMGSAEHRTTGDEPEIEPGREGSGDSFFDPFAPNDRFSEGGAAAPSDREPASNFDTFADDEDEIAAPSAESSDDIPMAETVEYSDDADVDDADDDDDDDLDLEMDEDYPSGSGRRRGRGDARSRRSRPRTSAARR